MTNGRNIVHKKGTTTKRPLFDSETKNGQKSQFFPGIRDIHKNQTNSPMCFEKMAKNQRISIDLGCEQSKVIQYGQQ